MSDTEFPQWKMKKNPFRLNKDILYKNWQEEFLEMKCNSSAKNDFEAMTLTDFWEKYLHMYQNVGGVALCTVLPFLAT